MILPRRQLLHLAVGAAALPFAPHVARAQTYPTRPVRIVVPITAGGANDIVARSIGQHLSKRLGQPFVIENRPGAGGNIGVEAVVRAAPDGHTLLLAHVNNVIGAALHDKLTFNYTRDIAPVSTIMRQVYIVLINPAVPATSIPEFIAHAKANPGKLNMASVGVGSLAHLCGELFKMMAGVDMVHVPYQGGSTAMTDLISGRVQVMFIGPGVSIEHVRSGKLRALAVTTKTRWDGLPSAPPVADFITGYEASSWFGIAAPKKTPPDIIEILNKEINAGLNDPEIKARIDQLGGVVLQSSPSEFERLVDEEIEKWGKVIRAANIKAQ